MLQPTLELLTDTCIGLMPMQSQRLLNYSFRFLLVRWSLFEKKNSLGF